MNHPLPPHPHSPSNVVQNNTLNEQADRDLSGDNSSSNESEQGAMPNHRSTMTLAATPCVVFGQADDLNLQAGRLRNASQKLCSRAAKIMEKAQLLETSALALHKAAEKDRAIIQQEFDDVRSIHCDVLPKYLEQNGRNGPWQVLALGVEEGTVTIEQIEEWGDKLSAWREEKHDKRVLLKKNFDNMRKFYADTIPVFLTNGLANAEWRRLFEAVEEGTTSVRHIKTMGNKLARLRKTMNQIKKSTQLTLSPSARQSTMATGLRRSLMSPGEHQCTLPTEPHQSFVPLGARQPIIPTVAHQSTIPTGPRFSIIPPEPPRSLLSLGARQSIISTGPAESLIPTGERQYDPPRPARLASVLPSSPVIKRESSDYEEPVKGQSVFARKRYRSLSAPERELPAKRAKYTAEHPSAVVHHTEVNTRPKHEFGADSILFDDAGPIPTPEDVQDAGPKKMTGRTKSKKAKNKQKFKAPGSQSTLAKRNKPWKKVKKSKSKSSKRAWT